MLTLRRPIKREVRNGAEYLDKVYGPSWDTKIDTKKLDIAASYNCVFGQLYGSFATGLVNIDMDLTRAEKLGVYTWKGSSGYRRLTEDWVRLIDKRQLARSA